MLWFLHLVSLVNSRDSGPNSGIPGFKSRSLTRTEGRQSEYETIQTIRALLQLFSPKDICLFPFSTESTSLAWNLVNKAPKSSSALSLHPQTLICFIGGGEYTYGCKQSPFKLDLPAMLTDGSSRDLISMLEWVSPNMEDSSSFFGVQQFLLTRSLTYWCYKVFV